ncbi:MULTISPECIES: hypothetical protein [unclassified Microcoleus]|uniref:hypothetical protein n=1 Tax=unclassified Microcoleus TaxID=2642155 RepID=UPI002FD6D2D8
MIEGSSATDYVTDVTDVKDRRKFGNGLCNGCNGCREEGSSATDYVTDVTDVTDVGKKE